MNKQTHPYFIADGESRSETAVLLVGTAREFGINQRDVAAVRGGFRISQALADVLYAEDQQEPEQEDTAQEPEQEPKQEDTAQEPEPVKPPAKRTTKRTSGNRAAKTSSSTDKE